ncbi:MAG: hypothetical protein ACC661_10785 [Verrucomicrobiales bacterium]
MVERALDAPSLEVPALDAPPLEVPALEVPALEVPALEVPALDTSPPQQPVPATTQQETGESDAPAPAWKSTPRPFPAESDFSSVTGVARDDENFDTSVAEEKEIQEDLAATGLAAQLRDFEARLRKKEAEIEAEISALRDELSLGAPIAPPKESGAAQPGAGKSALEGAAVPILSTLPSLALPLPSLETEPGDSAPGAPEPVAPPLESANLAARSPAEKVEGNSSSRELLIFRGSDPALWGDLPRAFAGGFGDVIPPARIGDEMKLLRIRRMDTGQSVIVALETGRVLGRPSGGPVIGWNGGNEEFEGAHHLGIFDHSLPQEVEPSFAAGGWGFGHYYGSRGGQAFAWGGIAIARTVFEISVCNRLPDAEELRETDSIFLDRPMIPASTETELVFFQSACPEIWNKNAVDGKGGFAFHVCRIPEKIQFLKMRRMDNGDAVIIPMTRDDLLRDPGKEPSFGWNGGNEHFFGGYHLGISDPAASKEIEIMYGCGGWGFGHPVDSNNTQAFAWNGEALSRTSFEFTAIARDLTDEERDSLLSRHRT